MAPITPRIVLTGLAQISEIVVPKSSKPCSSIIHCNFQLKNEKEGCLTIPVKTFVANGDVPPVGSYVLVDGPFWMLPDTDGCIEADEFQVVCDDSSVSLALASPSVTAVGTVANVAGRDIIMNVGAYERHQQKVVTYQLTATVPDDCCWANVRMPEQGANLLIQGIFSLIAVSGTYDNPIIEVTSMNFLPRTNFSRKGESFSGSCTKRQFVAEKLPHTPDTSYAMKKGKFTMEVLARGESGTTVSSDGSSPQAIPGGSSSASSSNSSPVSKAASPSIASSAISLLPSPIITPTPARYTRSTLKAEKADKMDKAESSRA
ncbi:hypothetical protein RHS03_08071, partial [Rhizoctonia solani]